MKICLYGAGSRKIDQTYIEKGYELGCKLAENNHSLIFGGGATGMMGAVLEGVLDNNGKAIGISPQWIDEFEKLSTHCSEFIYVDSMDERKKLFLEKSDCFIISPGGIGTLDEFFEILTLKKLKIHNKEIIIFNINHYYDTMLEMLEEMADKGFLYGSNIHDLVKIATSVRDVLDYLNNYI